MASTHPASTTNPASDKALQQTQGQAATKRKPKLPKAARQNSNPKADVAVTAKAEIKRSATGGGNGKVVEGSAVRETKTEIVLKKLRSTKGASITQIMDATGWQAHSVRGFLSAVVRAKLGLTLVSEIGRDGIRLYRVEGAAD